MAIGEIDGDYVTGICFVGFVNMAARAGLLLAPLAATIIVSGYIIVRGLILLIKVRIDSREIISEHSSRKIRSNIVRMGVFTIFMLVFSAITFGYHNYIAVNSDSWSASLQNYILRTANAGLDGQHINSLLSNGKLVIPCNRNNFKSGSEDENVSVTISENNRASYTCRWSARGAGDSWDGLP
ncbi:hypothetical protein NQ317_010403 [Molorchus minor]|uniref:Frizzled/Smoothened 7TM domain-containing protein n=1 Tax=Molorchus minor TaxID=1323400 RepID=A0ABQ9J7I0_9CUCU|nr:hypothetical protein NQ317_010403 [Molorchus minor]